MGRARSRLLWGAFQGALEAGANMADEARARRRGFEAGYAEGLERGYELGRGDVVREVQMLFPDVAEALKLLGEQIIEAEVVDAPQ